MNTFALREPRTASTAIRRSALTAAVVSFAALGAQGAQAQTIDPTVAAESTGLYVGAGYEYLDIDGDGALGDTDLDALGLRAGFQSSPFLAFEADALFGIDHGDYDFDGGLGNLAPGATLDEARVSSGRLNLDYLFGVYVRGNLPLTDAIDLSARLGYAFAGFDSTGDLERLTTIDVDGSDDGLSGGVSLGYDIDENLTLRADYTRYDFDSLEANGYGLSVDYTFR